LTIIVKHSHQNPVMRHLINGGILVIASMLFFGSVLMTRQSTSLHILSPIDLFQSIFDVFAISLAVRTVIIPLVLFAILSTTPFYRKYTVNRFKMPFPWVLLLFLVVTQLISIFLERFMFLPDPDRLLMGQLLVIAAGLLLGWRGGVFLGFITAFIVGMQFMLLIPNFSLILTRLFREDGMFAAVTHFSQTWFQIFFFQPHVTVFLWVGVVSGVTARWLGPRSLRLGPAFALGFVISLGAALAFILVAEHPEFVGGLSIPAALAFGLALSGISLLDNNSRTEANNIRIEAAELAQTQAELQALRSQINPHFLFNAINTIRYCVRTDPEMARKLLIDLSEIFEHILRSGDCIPLQEEIEHIEAYLSIEKARLGERLQVIWKRPQENSALYQVRVPTLILQPIVENAIIHGIGRMEHGGQVSISISSENDHLYLSVEDDGPGISPVRLAEVMQKNQDHQKCIGLCNVDFRLRALYGDDHHLVVQSQNTEGTHIEMRIPIEEFCRQ
jgi:signal transduction histidine kinase